MNERDFILLVEEYLDGSLTPERRSTLRAAVQTDPVFRRRFEEQARQHIRIHAQTSRVDFSESQHIAMMAVDIAEKHRHPNAFMDLLRRKTLRERLGELLRGLRADRDSIAFRIARDQLMRLFGPMTVSILVNVALILLIVCWVPMMTSPVPKPEGVGVTVDPTSKDPPILDPIIPPTTPSGEAATERTIPIILAGADLKPDPRRDAQPPEADPGGGSGVVTDDKPGLADTLAPLPPGTGKARGTIPTLGGRNEGTRVDILEKIPRSRGTESAVIKSLQWLKAHQEADGSWPGQDRAAMTGLALLAYLAHGELTASTQFGDTVTRGLKYLIGHQDSRGYFSANVYAHAIATYAVSEAFTLTRIMDLRSAMDKGVRVILEGQQPGGGFDYDYRKNPRFDTSVTGWQIQALKAARLAGTEIAGLDEGLSRAVRFLENDAFAYDGSGFVYEGKSGAATLSGGRASMTGVGTLCLQILGRPNTPQARSGLRALQKAELDWPENGKAGVYAGYYIAQTKFWANDKLEWPTWNRQMQQKLILRQKPDGHWEQGDYDTGSHVYTTTLCTLMLEVYYRYLPTSAKRPESAPQKGKTPGDVPIDFR
ncbi:MAG: hypothetical protein WCG36_02475 [bacterium]